MTGVTLSETDAGAAPEPLFDRAHLGEIMGMNDALALAEFYAIYLRQTQQLPADLRAASAVEDLSALERLAHKFKSSTNFVGARPLAGRLEQLEALCRAGERQRVQDLLASTATLAERSLHEIAAWRDQLLQSS